MTKVDLAIKRKGENAMGTNTFKNGVTDEGTQKRYRLSATLIGIRIVPTLGSKGKKMMMPYELLDYSVTGDEKIAEAVNTFILKNTEEKQQNLLIWNFENDMAYKELQRILVKNMQLERKFDKGQK